jgi:hypothetical protein
MYIESIWERFFKSLKRGEVHPICSREMMLFLKQGSTSSEAGK